ncbi:hypothetical protein HC823_02120 [Candidatus Gracilibacteria bacterium]|nr:hypothetical protein [Candidatus Gracilibacteria bacterium]
MGKRSVFQRICIENANVWVSNFKRKITARKQNRMNVFWTLKLTNEEQAHSQVLSDALITTLNTRLEELNAETEFPLEITTPRVFSETQDIPLLWVIPAIIVLALGIVSISIYAYESLNGRISYLAQIHDLLPESPLLRVNQHPGKHDAKLLEQFIMSFDSPQVIGTFPIAGEYFTTTSRETLDEARDTPVLLIKLGETKIRELENLMALFGPDMALIVFEK